MKKRIFFIIASFCLCNFLIGPQKYSQARVARDTIKLPSVHTMADINAFKNSVIRAQRAYRNNPEMFLKFLNTKTADGLTPLMYASAVAGDEIIAFLINQAEEAFGSNKNLMMRFLNAQDDDGNTALYLATTEGTYSTIKTLVSKALEALQSDKQLFFQLLTTPPKGSLWTPLHILTYDSKEQPILFLVEQARNVLGQDSELYNKFINAQNEDGATPLSYALMSDIRFFLIKAGATVYSALNKSSAAAVKQGKDLIDAVSNDDLEKFKKILQNATAEYKNQQNNFIAMMSARDESGWTALMHAAANNKLEFIQNFFDYVGDFFKDSDVKTDLFDVISNVAVDGKTALILAISRRHFKAASMIIDKATEYAKNKIFYYMFVNAPEQRNGFTALISAAYNSSNEEEFYRLIEKLINSVTSRFEKDSHTLFHFINAVDNSGNTALSYAADPRTRALLAAHGGRDPHAYDHPRMHVI